MISGVMITVISASRLSTGIIIRFDRNSTTKVMLNSPPLPITVNSPAGPAARRTTAMSRNGGDGSRMSAKVMRSRLRAIGW